ncbi:MAG TPA: coenzyme F420-0:L-glutamate ligase [Acetobacteraceae bacterium]|nr:coenzyme F420-0:L-glutamate ligase [Acetobacteraceae bacterium]
MIASAADKALQLLPLPGLPLVRPGDDLAELIAEALARGSVTLRADDVVAVAQKIVSKAENRAVALDTVVPSARAVALGAEIGKDARLVEVILSESVRVVRSRPNLLITEHRLGFVMANAGVDHSNVAAPGEPDQVLLLPLDPDASAARLRAGLAARFGVAPGVVVTDSFGRPWRRGTCGVAIGAAGIASLIDMRGKPDLFGRTLEVTIIARADEIAAAAGLLQGQAGEGRPVVLLRGLAPEAPILPAAALVRPAAEDLFR